ncbi:hypothetical protein ACJJIL_16890 [Microbulbifer sp. EKSA005]|uniref:hypothetical protein n=1 Tax=Microbulbifer sp. EKSA005 TaxID=3243364 RepID=UPI0040416759
MKENESLSEDLAILEEHLSIDSEALPKLSSYDRGSFHEVEFSFLTSLIEHNPKKGTHISSGFDYEDSYNRNYLDLFNTLIKLSNELDILKSVSSSIDKSGNETISCKINDSEFSWIGNSWNEYMDLNVLESMISTLNNQLNGSYYLASVSNEEIPVIYSDKNAIESISRILKKSEELINNDLHPPKQLLKATLSKLDRQNKFCFQMFVVYEQASVLIASLEELDREVTGNINKELSTFHFAAKEYIDKGRQLTIDGTEKVDASVLLEIKEEKIHRSCRGLQKFNDADITYLCDGVAEKLAYATSNMDRVNF